MKKIFIFIVATLILALPSGAIAASSNDIQATVQLATYDANSSFASGTGFFVSSMGTVLTNADVIWDSTTNSPREDITILTVDSESGIPKSAYTMEVWDYSKEHNLALLSPKYPVDDNGFALDEYIGFNNSINNPYISLSPYSPADGDGLEFISFDDTALLSPLTLNSTTVSSFSSEKITTGKSITQMSSGGPAFYNNEAIGLKIAGADIVRSETVFKWFQEMTSDFTLTQPFIEVTFGSDYNSMLSDYQSGTPSTTTETPPAVTTPTPSTSTPTVAPPSDSVIPTSTTVDTTDYSNLSQDVQDFIGSMQKFVREGQATMDGELMKMSDLSAKERSLYPSDVVNPLLYSNMDPSSVTITGFPDVSTSHPNGDAIFGLANMGMIKGYPDGTFKPDGDINRAELIKMVTLMRVITIPQVADYNNCFPDVGSEWFAAYVCYAETVGWIQGYPDGTFKPSQNVNRAEALKIILNSWFYETGVVPSLSNGKQNPVDSDSTAWYFPFLNYAVQEDILDLQHASYSNGFHYFVGDNMKRKEVAETLMRLLTK
jgi:S-layer homology domain